MPNSDDKFLLLLEKVTEISERTARMEVKLERVEEDVKGIQAEDSKQNQLLAEHIQGTVSNRQRLEIEIKNREDLEKTSKDMDVRISKLEEAPKFLKNLKTVIKWIVAVGAGIATIYAWFK